MTEGKVVPGNSSGAVLWDGEALEYVTRIDGGRINADTVYYGAGAVSYRPPTVEDVEAYLFNKYPKLKEFLQGEDQ